MEKEAKFTPLNQRDAEDAKKIQSMGGVQRGKNIRKRKTLKEAYLAIADKPYKPIGELAETVVEMHGEITVDEAIMLAMTVKAAAGDVQAAAYIRDTIGEKPKERVEVAQDKPFEVIIKGI